MLINYTHSINKLLTIYNKYINKIHIEEIRAIIVNYELIDNELNMVLPLNKINKEEYNDINCRYTYKILKFFYYLLKRKYIIHIKCSIINCNICNSSKFKLRYYTNNEYLKNFFINSNMKYFDKQINLITLTRKLLYKKKLPDDIINIIINNYNPFICKNKQMLMRYLKDLCHYNFNINIILKNKKFKKYLQFDKICGMNNNCKNCKLILEFLRNIINIIEYNKINYKTCNNYMDLSPIVDMGFNYFIYENDKDITTDDYEIMPFLIDDYE